MSNIIKKDKEYKILIKVYSDKSLKIESSEKPDFIIKSNEEKFGVEITEYYYNEASARIKNYAGYTEKILNSNLDDILDKRDRGIISKSSLYVKCGEENKYSFLSNIIETKYNNTYRFGELPKFQDVEKQLIKIIKNKNEKTKHYNKCLEYTELFIEDKENYLCNHMLELNNSEQISNEVAKSELKRVYIFSDEYLIVIGTNPAENVEKYNKGENDG